METTDGWGVYREDLDNDGYDVGDPLVNPFGKYQDTNGTWQKSSNAKPASKAPVNFNSLYNYGTVNDFLTKVDNSVAGQMRDCAECHVGGGAMQYIPVAPGTDLSADPRQELRSAVFDGNFTAYNYFIGQYEGSDASGNLVNAGDVYQTDYNATGVLEMDCLMCHMEGYSWENRKNEIRLGRFDASRAVGSGLASSSINGTAVNYDPLYIAPFGNALLFSQAALDRFRAAPPSENCSSCHFDLQQVDWKKRGTSWNSNMAYETEVHYSLGCMGCHDGKQDHINGIGAAKNGSTDILWDGTANGNLGHDPAKGYAPFSSLWNNTDGTVKTCEDCHIDQIAGNHGAPDPTAKHAAMGLNATLVQDGRDGNVDARHLDIIHCSACHTRKLGHGPTAAMGGTTHGSLYEWGTGGAMVDSTGPDDEGRLTDHENLYVERTMEDNLAYAWDKSYKKITPRNALVTMFWRDYGTADINADGQAGGMDPVNPSHVRNVMGNFGYEAMTQDGDVNATEFTKIKNALLDTTGGLAAYGIDTTGSDLKLSFMGVLFMANHNTSPASYAWGSGGCTDCHNDGAGFYNGLYEVKPRDLNLDLNSGQVGPFTTVNGGQKSDFHPTTFAKDQYGIRSIAVQVASDDSDIRAVDRSEFLYEDNMTKNGGTPRYANNGTAYTARTEWVNHLDNIVAGMDQEFHNVHLRNEFDLACDDCHKSIAEGNFTVDVDPASAPKCANCHEGMKPGLHTVHLDKEIDCSACHWNSVGTFEVNSDPDYEFFPFPETRPAYSVNGSFTVNGYKYPANYDETTDTTCNEWAVYPAGHAQEGQFYCANETSGTSDGEVLSCSTKACHGSTQGGGYGRYDENKVDARFSVRQTDYNATTNMTTVEFDASKATCVSWEIVNSDDTNTDANETQYSYTSANCTYSWSFYGNSNTDGNTTGAVELVTYTDGAYSAELTMTMEGTGADNTQFVDFTTPINTYTGDRYDAGGRW